MNFQNFIRIFTVVSLLAANACGRKDIDKIGEAQNCLDTSTRSTVSQCVEKVSGIESSGAYVIRCAATFIQDGFDDPTRLANALGNMTNSTTGSSGASASVAVMSVLAFTGGATSAQNSANAQTALAYCAKSASKGLILLSSIASIATTAVYLGSSTDMTTALTNAKDDPTAQGLVGDAAISAYTSNCTGTTVTSNAQFCNQFSTIVTNAGGTSSSACVGKQLMYYYTNPTATAPSC